jgi:predicted transcriptional regulator
MSDPVNIKTSKIYQNSKKKLLSDKIENLTFNTEEVYEVLSNNSSSIFPAWIRLQQSWCTSAYKTFNDYDTYLILVYLVQQVFKKYSDRFQYLSMEDFYNKRNLQIEKINLIEISKDLNIPKETIRRKVNWLQNKNIIYRKGKSIFFDSSIVQFQKPNKSIKLMANYLEKSANFLVKEDWFGDFINKEQIEIFIEKYFTFTWQHWFRFQIPFLIRHRTFFGDLETWNVWGSIGISQYYEYAQSIKNNIIETPNSSENMYLSLLKFIPKNGINASSISEISSIPRATVIRKLKYLVKNKLVKKNKKLEYHFFQSSKNLQSFKENYLTNQKQIGILVTTIFDLMKNSKFKI